MKPIGIASQRFKASFVKSRCVHFDGRSHRRTNGARAPAFVAAILALLIILTACRDEKNSPATSGPNRCGSGHEAQSAVTGSSGQPADSAAAAKSFTNSIGMKLVLVPSGQFMMGSKETAQELAGAYKIKNKNVLDFEREHPRHCVRITKPFFMGATHVTVSQFRRFVDDTGFKTEAEKNIARTESGGGGIALFSDGSLDSGPQYNWRNPGFKQGDEHPVVNVSWDDAVAFCKW
jgi:formylglycine-generating enzyme required for sulfatase activity